MFLYSPRTSPHLGMLPKPVWALLRPQMKCVGLYSRQNSQDSSTLSFINLPAAVRSAVGEVLRTTGWPYAEVGMIDEEYLVFASKGRETRHKHLVYPVELSGALGEKILWGARELAVKNPFAFTWREREGPLAVIFLPLFGIAFLYMAVRLVESYRQLFTSSKWVWFLLAITFSASLLAIFGGLANGMYRRHQLRQALDMYGHLQPPPPKPEINGPVREF